MSLQNINIKELNLLHNLKVVDCVYLQAWIRIAIQKLKYIDSNVAYYHKTNKYKDI